MLRNRNIATIIIALLGAVKLALQAFGIDIITDQQINEIADGAATLITVAGVLMTHLKPIKIDKTSAQPTKVDA